MPYIPDDEEDPKKKRLREIARAQMEAQRSKEPEPGIEEVSATEVPGRAAILSRLKKEMPVLGEAADVIIPQDLEDIIPGVRAGKKAFRAAEKALSEGELKKLAAQLRRSEGTEAVEKLMKSAPEERAAKYAEKFSIPEKEAEKFIEEKRIGIVKSKPKEGETLDYTAMKRVKPEEEAPVLKYGEMGRIERKPEGPSLGEYWKEKSKEEPMWKRKMREAKERGYR